MSLGKQERSGRPSHRLLQPVEVDTANAVGSDYALLVRLGRARAAIESCALGELWSALVTNVRSLTSAAAVSVAAAEEEHRVGGRAGPSVVWATAGQVDPSDRADGAALINVPIELGERRVGRVTLLGASGQTFTAMHAEIARQLVSAAVTRLAIADPARTLPLAGLRLEPREPRAEVSSREALVSHAFELAPAALAVLDVSAEHPGRIMKANAQLAALLGYSREQELSGRTAEEYIHPEDVRLFRQRLQTHDGMAAGGGGLRIRLKTRHGTMVAASVRGVIRRPTASPGDADGGEAAPDTPSALCHISCPEERAFPVKARLDSDWLFQGTFQKTPVGMMLITMAPARRGRVCIANPALSQMLRRDDDELVGRPLEFLMPAEEAHATLAVLDILAGTGTDSARTQRQFVRADDEILHCWFSAIVIDETTPGGPFVLCHVVDLTAQRGQQRALERMALTDSLTQLPNRSGLTARVDQALARIERGSRVALMVLDLDRFKNVNDGLGHHFGDLLLMEVATRLGALEHPGASVARQGGDEFTVLLEGVAADDEVTSLAEKLLVLLTGDYRIGDDQVVSTSVSIGVAIADSGDRTREQLMREADLALYAAKAAGRNRFVLCGEELLAAASRRQDCEQRLRRALHCDGLRVLLQPIVCLDAGQVQALEALVRVQDPEIGTLQARQIIKVAEDSGLIGELDRWVMDEAVRLVTVDPRLVDSSHSRVNINVSARTLEQPGLPRHFSDVLAKHGVPGDRIAIELTESSWLGEDPAVCQAIVAFRRLGAHIGIDDFGTGYSALAYLERFPVDFLKIDQSFVARLGSTDQRSRATVAAIIALAHAHGLQVIAEGIETPAQRDMLRDLGCDAGQGWLFGTATASDTVEH